MTRLRFSTYAASLLFVMTVILPSAMADPTVIGGVAYENVDEGDPFTEAPAPSCDWKAPEPCRAERRAGLMAFVADDPGEYVPNRIPRSAERVESLDLFVSQGETTCFSVGIHALERVEGLSAEVDPGSAPVCVERRAHPLLAAADQVEVARVEHRSRTPLAVLGGQTKRSRQQRRPCGGAVQPRCREDGGIVVHVDGPRGCTSRTLHAQTDGFRSGETRAKGADRLGGAAFPVAAARG